GVAAIAIIGAPPSGGRGRNTTEGERRRSGEETDCSVHVRSLRNALHHEDGYETPPRRRGLRMAPPVREHRMPSPARKPWMGTKAPVKPPLVEVLRQVVVLIPDAGVSPIVLRQTVLLVPAVAVTRILLRVIARPGAGRIVGDRPALRRFARPRPVIGRRWRQRPARHQHFLTSVARAVPGARIVAATGRVRREHGIDGN